MQRTAPGGGEETWARQRVRSLSLALRDVGLGLLPVVILTASIGNAASRDILAYDAETGYLPFARRLLHGISPYPEANLPPLGMSVFVPFAPLPRPEILLTVLAVVAVPAVLFALDVRDWRCYGAVFLWPPVLSAIQTVNLTVFLVLAAALSWRWRDRLGLCSVATGLAIAAKLISAPLVIWLAATRRLRAAVLSTVVALAVSVGLLLVIQAFGGGEAGTFGGEAGTFVGKATRVPVSVDTFSYSPLDVLSGAGLPRWVGAAVVLCCVVVLCGLSVRFGRVGDDRRSFAAAAVAIIVFAPNIWLHSIAFLMLTLGVLRPRFDALWLVPVALVLCPVRNPSTQEWLILWSICGFVAGWAMLRPTVPTAPPDRAGSAPRSVSRELSVSASRR